MACNIRWRLRLELQQRQRQRQRPKTNAELNVRILFAAQSQRNEGVASEGGCWLRNSGWHCVVCTLCLPAKMHVNETIWSEICKHAAKMHFVLCKGKSIGAWLGFALPDLPNVMTMPATRCLSTHTHTDKQLQFNAFVLVAFGIRFRYSLITSSLWVNMFLNGRKQAQIQEIFLLEINDDFSRIK